MVALKARPRILDLAANCTAFEATYRRPSSLYQVPRSFFLSSLSPSSSNELALHCDTMAPTTTTHDLLTELVWMIAENLDGVGRMQGKQKKGKGQTCSKF